MWKEYENTPPTALWILRIVESKIKAYHQDIPRNSQLEID